MSVMETRTTFSDSNDMMSNETGSICNNTETLTSSSSQQQHQSSTDLQSLNRLSENLSSILHSKTLDSYSDVKFSFSDGREISAHVCILSARSSFFRNLFSNSDKRKVRFEMRELAREFDVGFDAMVCVLEYVYGGKVRALVPKGEGCVCVDDEGCEHLSCRPVVDFVLEVLYASFVFQIYDLVAAYQIYLLEVLDKVQIDDMLVVLSVANMCSKACDKLLTKCAKIIVKSDIDNVTLEKSLPHPIVKQITDSRHELGLEGNNFPDKHVKRIHRALDSDDVELLRMLLKEGHTTLDDAHALHYAVAYCDAKTTTELLELGLADVCLRNTRGYTVLHVAAMRKDPKIIVSLLTKGARPSDLTADGRKALQISKRLTRAIDYHKSTEEGKSSPKNRLCIEVLEQAERRDPLLGEASISLALAGDDLRMRLLYLENRVGLAKLLFPMEAKVAMDIAQVDGTSEFPIVSSRSNNTMDLNDSPLRIQEEHLNRLRALSKTVELGKRFFPRCSEVLNRIMDADDLSELASMRNCNGEDRLSKERRYNELKDLLTLAFTEDKEEFGKSTILSSSSSTSMEVVRSNINLTTRNK